MMAHYLRATYVVVLMAVGIGCYQSNRSGDAAVDSSSGDGIGDSESPTDNLTDNDSESLTDGDSERFSDTVSERLTDSDTARFSDNDSERLTDGDGESDSESESEQPCTDGVCISSTCSHDGVVFNVGAVVEISCQTCTNRCTCEDLGEGLADWSCTECECPTTCEYNGVIYKPGDSFLAADGCNECECEMSSLDFDYTEALVSCTDADCELPQCEYEGETYDVGQGVAVPCSTCENDCRCEDQGDGTADWNCDDCGCAQYCWYKGVSFAPGQVYRLDDGCNRCECLIVSLGMGITEAQLSCTQEDCSDPSCTHNRDIYFVSDSVDVPCSTCDNVCTCEETAEGLVDWVCTDCQCPQECAYEGVVYQPGESYPSSDDCNTCYCELADIGFGYMEAHTSCTLLICK